MKGLMPASAFAVLLAAAACQGQRSGSEERPAADTPATAPAAGEAIAQPSDSGPEEPVTPPTPADTSGQAASRDTTQAAQDTAFAGTAEPIRRTRSAPPVAILGEVRAAEHAGYDRIVFEFANGPLPGYHVEFAAGALYQCGSGDEVSVAGSAPLVVRLEPAQAHDDRGNATIVERQRLLALPVVKELTIICDFEAQVEWVAGLAARTTYRVLELSEPPRLVLDVRH